MKSRNFVQEISASRASFFWALVLAFLWLGFSASTALAKEPSLTAIELYDGPTGPAYVQLTDVLINGKVELRECKECQAAGIDKSTYGKLGKLVLGPGAVLERGTDGALRYSFNHGPQEIVAPVNVKFEHNAALSASDLAEQALLKGTPIGSATGVVPPIKKGVTLVFIAAPDVELAEFLLAQRMNNIPGWQAYLAKYSAAPHVADAKSALAVLFIGVGVADLNTYDKSAATASPTYDDLKAAKSQYDHARALAPGGDSLAKLDAGIKSRLSAIVDQGRGELNAYRTALTAKTAGYIHLQNAGKFAATVSGIDPGFPAGQALQGDVLRDNNTYQSALRTAQSAIDAKQFDQALTFVAPYRAFADEDSHVAAVIDADYQEHMAAGEQSETTPDWAKAIKEYVAAKGAKDTTEAEDRLKNAREQLVITQDKAAAAKALAASQEYEQSKDMLHAYQALSDLTAVQQKLVADDMERLKPAYVQAASDEANKLRKAFEPIVGIANERGIETAYDYLKEAYELSGDEGYHDRMALLSNELSAYLLEKAKHYFEKPSGSGAELGWTYLTEALPYKADNLDAVRDAMTANTQLHVMRAKLSIRVVFRDQTSQRDSAGFAGQLENAIVTGLETSGVPVKVVRNGDTTPVEPDYQLAGDVLVHHISNVPMLEPLESKYRASTEQVVSDQWNKANRDYEKATMDLQAAEAALQGAEAKAKGNKKQVETLTDQVQADEKIVQDAHAKLDATTKLQSVDVERPYTYTRKTVTLTGVVQLQFRMSDSFSGETAELVPIRQELKKAYVSLINVKSDDTAGVKGVETDPDPDELGTSIEGTVIEGLKAEVRKRVDALPQMVYKKAAAREADADMDGAGESYLRYLEITPDADSAERKHAKQYLDEQFNMHPNVSSTP